MTPRGLSLGAKARQSPLFFDLTISLSKSISIFHASLGENARLARHAGDQDGDQYWSALASASRLSAYRSESGSFSATRHAPLRLSQKADHDRCSARNSATLPAA